MSRQDPASAGEKSDAPPASPSPKKIRYQEPDVLVVVGDGESKEEFQCHGVVLSMASDYLDAMLSSNMKEGESSRIDFKDKSPEDWKLFFTFIDPTKLRKAELTIENIPTVLPWFHEFGMSGYLDECDTILSKIHPIKCRMTIIGAIGRMRDAQMRWML